MRPWLASTLPRPLEMETTMTRILFFGRVGERLGSEGRLDLPDEGLCPMFSADLDQTAGATR